ncbi:hypothetical protein MY10362_009191 [Beauveria mimosiformis]
MSDFSGSESTPGRHVGTGRMHQQSSDQAITPKPTLVMASPVSSIVPNQAMTSPISSIIPGQVMASPVTCTVPGQVMALPVSCTVPGRAMPHPMCNGEPFLYFDNQQMHQCIMHNLGDYPSSQACYIQNEYSSQDMATPVRSSASLFPIAGQSPSVGEGIFTAPESCVT